MSTLNDAIMEATGGPTANEGQLAWFQTHGAPGITDYAQAERKFLEVSTATSPGGTLTNADLWRKFLVASGYLTPGMSLNTAMYAYWLDQAGEPPQQYAYSWTIGQQGTDYGYIRGVAGDLVPNDWPEVPGTTIGILGVNSANALYIRQWEQSQIRVGGTFSVLIEIEGASTGLGPGGSFFTLAWEPNDYYIIQANVANFVRNQVGQTLGVNMRNFNNWLTVGTNGTLWGWNNGLGFGAMGDVGFTYQWPFSTTIVNFYCDAADLLTVQFSQGNSLSTIHVTIPSINGGQPLAISGNGVTFTQTIPGVKALFQSAQLANLKLPVTITT